MRASASRSWAWIGAAALAIRLAPFALALPHADRFLVEEDASEYWQLGQNLAAGHGFSQSPGPPYVPDVRRTPVFPVAVAAVSLIPGAGVFTVALFNIVASLLTVVIVARVGANLFGDVAGRAAGLLLGLDLTSAAYANQVMSEPLFTLLMMTAVLILAASADAGPYTDRLPRAGPFTAGLAAGLAALCRPIGVLVALALLPACRRSATGRRRALVAWAIVVAVQLALVAAWTIRNQKVGGLHSPSSVAAVNVYLHRAAYVEARRQGRPVEDIQREWEAELRIRTAGWSEGDRSAWLVTRGREMLLAHPIDYAIAWAAGISRMFRPDHVVLPELAGLDRRAMPWNAIFSVAWLQLVILYALALWGTAAALRQSPRAAAVPLCLLGYFLALSGPEMYPRFRVPLMPAICLLAGAGLQDVAARLRGFRVPGPEGPRLHSRRS